MVARRHNSIFIVTREIFLLGIFIQDFLFYFEFSQKERLCFYGKLFVNYLKTMKIFENALFAVVSDFTVEKDQTIQK